MSCGHTCDLNCHPFSHEDVDCKKHCNRRLECGHPCTEVCYLPCKSECACDNKFQPFENAGGPTKSHKESRAAPFTYAQAATGSYRIPLAGVTDHATLFSESPEREEQVRHYPKDTGLLHFENRVVDKDRSNRDVPQNTQSYRDFAAGGHVQSDKNLVTLAERGAAEAQTAKLDEENYAALFGDRQDDRTIDEGDKMTLFRKKSNGKSVWKGTWRPSRSESVNRSENEKASLLD